MNSGLGSRNLLVGRSAIVTGAGGGIGREIALAFAREGARVCLADILVERAVAVADEILQAGGTAMALRMDVGDPGSVDAGVSDCCGRLGGVDILVSNAGNQHLEEIHDLTFERWKEILRVHLDGGFLTAQACLRRMRAQSRGGVILLMGSVHSKEASEKKGPYVVAKHGLLGLCRVLAKEGAKDGIRANLICPGFVKTPLVEKQIPELSRELGIAPQAVVKDVFLKGTVDGEFTAATDVADVAVFLAAFPSNALTGQSIVVSHGWHMA